MGLRWTAAGMLEAERQFRRVVGYRDLAKLAVAVISEFGKPESTQESENEGLGEDSCIYYNVKGGGALDQWQFCFDSDDQLTGKNRL